MATEAAKNIICKDSLISNGNLLALVNGSETALHSHAGGGGGIYVDRGDPTGFDITQATLTMDSAWHDLNLSSIVGSNAALVHLRVVVSDNTIGSRIRFRENGNSNVYNVSTARAQAVNNANDDDIWVVCDSSGIIEYESTAGITSIVITVAGWSLI